MDGPTSTPEVLKPPQEHKIGTPASKNRKVVQRSVVTVRVEANVGNQKGEGPPSDFWSWRKYGQKPIKGSPYPRGYYRCSTSKGCLAKKQVEKCRTDASVILITYTSNHNHPGPDLFSLQYPSSEAAPLTTKITKQSTATSEPAGLHLPPKFTQEVTQHNPLTDEGVEKPHHEPDICDDEVGPDGYSSIVISPAPNSPKEEDDFFDELEELPISSSSFTGLVRSSFFDERALLPS